MPAFQRTDVRPHLAVRCDGDHEVGAGHVARCIPLAQAFRHWGWEVTFVGSYGGLAEWLLERSGQLVRAPQPSMACGLDPEIYEAAIIDSYRLAESEICDLAEQRPIATLGEANRCRSAGIRIDYHLDRVDQESTARLLAGPAYAPLDPAFAGAGRAGDPVRTVLITVGGSDAAKQHLQPMREIVSQVFPEAQIIVPGASGTGAGPQALVDLVGTADLALTAAGLTVYELACAGVPQVAVAIVANQQRVIRALRASGLAPCVDLCAGEPLERLAGALESLCDGAVRRRQAGAGTAIFDGEGAKRAAAALQARWSAVRADVATIEPARPR